MGDPLRSELPREPGCGGAARRLVERFLRERRLEALTDDARIVVSELVNNAYLHGRGRIELTVRLIDPGRIRIEASDQGSALVRVRRPDGLGGHGLQIVSKVAVAWGADRRPTRVWAELAGD
jgi:anti-sigma regulatory factor (Ser/Thr protein kinase)